MIELNESYVTTVAENKAKEFLSIDKNQIRKFYDDFKIIERKIDENQDANDAWFQKEILPHIKFVKSKIAYSAGRKSNNKFLVSREYKEYMDKEIDKIKTISDFKTFLMHYQAIIAYYTYHSEVKDKSYQPKPNK
ncbi:MAG: type III-A CRISPR-associated protein Csm2 [Spirochaetota bacterium]